MRWWRLSLVVLAALVTAVVAAVLAIAINVVTGGSAPWFPGLDPHPLRWTAGAAAGTAVSSLLAWWAQHRYDGKPRKMVPAKQRVEPWMVVRPHETEQVVAALTRGGMPADSTVVIYGAGGFGKTTIATMACADSRVLDWFDGGIYWVTLGRDIGKETLAKLISELVSRIDPEHPVTFTDSRQASEHLAAIFASGPRRLLMLDDVWTSDQLASFPAAGRCARLVTTRAQSLTARAAASIQVGELSPVQARALLEQGLPQLPPAMIGELIKETARMPLLLRLVNQALAKQAESRPDLTQAIGEVLARLRSGGKLQADELAGAEARQLDATDPADRAKAVRATIQASASLLQDAAEYERFTELGVFAADEALPVTLVGPLWDATGGLDEMASRALCARLADLALLTLTAHDDGTITLHDVIRDFLRGELGDAHLEQLHRLLLEGAAGELSAESRANGDADGTLTAWWELPGHARYMRDHLIEHMLAAGRADEAAHLAVDLRWVAERLERSGPPGPSADLALIGTSLAQRLGRVLGQVAHLLAPTTPPHSLADILYNRVSHDPDWGVQARALIARRRLPALVSAWPLPDLPDPALRRTLGGSHGLVKAVAIAPDGKWLATGHGDGTVRIWNPGTGLQAAAFAPAPHERVRTASRRDRRRAANSVYAYLVADRDLGITALAIAPDGAWVAAAGKHDKDVRVWDVATGERRATLTHPHRMVSDIAVSPDGTWLATVANDGIIRIWDTGTWQSRALAPTHFAKRLAIGSGGTWVACACDGLHVKHVEIIETATGRRAVLADGWFGDLAVAPDGTWVAGASLGRHLVWLWDSATGQERAVLAGHTGQVTAVASSPDGSWLATGSWDRTVRIWDATTGRQRATLPSLRQRVEAVAIAADGTWLASVGSGQGACVWDTVTHPRDTLPGQVAGGTNQVGFSPNGAWLATADGDSSVRIWDSATGGLRKLLSGHTQAVRGVAIAPDGTWLASASKDRSVRTWDFATGREVRLLEGHTRTVNAVAIAPDGTWLASAGEDEVRVWDAATGMCLASLGWDSRFASSVAIAPDGSWLAWASHTGSGSVGIWDPATRRPIGTLKGHRGTIPAVTIASDGTWLASGGGDATVRIWDMSTRGQRTPLTGHARAVTAVTITSDGTCLASASKDGSVRTWDPASARALAVMRVEGEITSCAWSPTGRILAVGGAAGLYLFTFNP